MRLIARRSRLAPPPSRCAVNRPLRCPCPDLAPTRRIPRAFPNLPGHSGRPKDPQNPRALVSGELLRRGCGRRRLSWLEKGTEASRPIPVVHLRSDGSISNSPSPILAAYRRSDGPGPLPPHPAPALPAGPACQPPAPALPAGPACQPPTPALPAGPACQPSAPALPAWPRLSAAQAAARSRPRPRI
jgi:hypothetical protein